MDFTCVKKKARIPLLSIFSKYLPVVVSTSGLCSIKVIIRKRNSDLVTTN